MNARAVKRVGYIIVSSDRGLCGGLNSNLFRHLVREIRAQRDAGTEIEFCTIGTKALGFFRRVGGKVMTARWPRTSVMPHISTSGRYRQGNARCLHEQARSTRSALRTTSSSTP